MQGNAETRADQELVNQALDICRGDGDVLTARAIGVEPKVVRHWKEGELQRPLRGQSRMKLRQFLMSKARKKADNGVTPPPLPSAEPVPASKSAGAPRAPAVGEGEPGRGLSTMMVQRRKTEMADPRRTADQKLVDAFLEKTGGLSEYRAGKVISVKGSAVKRFRSGPIQRPLHKGIRERLKAFLKRGGKAKAEDGRKTRSPAQRAVTASMRRTKAEKKEAKTKAEVPTLSPLDLTSFVEHLAASLDVAEASVLRAIDGYAVEGWRSGSLSPEHFAEWHRFVSERIS